MPYIRRMSLNEVLKSDDFKTAIEEIAAQSYSNPDVLLEQEFKKNNTAYLSIDANGKVQAFFLVGWSTLEVGDRERDCVFLGLSAVRKELKGGALAVSLYRAFFQDAKQYASKTGTSVAWWFHTASPIVAGVMWRVAPNIGPSKDGMMSSRHLELLNAIVKHFGFVPFQHPELPFILQAIAKARYSVTETARLGSRLSRQASPLTGWNIQERAGDRLLFVGYSDGD